MELSKEILGGFESSRAKSWNPRTNSSDDWPRSMVGKFKKLDLKAVLSNLGVVSDRDEKQKGFRVKSQVDMWNLEQD